MFSLKDIFQRIQAFAHRRKAKSLFVCLLFSILFWVVVTLSQTYRYAFKHRVIFTDEVSSKTQAEPDAEITVIIESSGYDLLYHQWFLRHQTVSVPTRNITSKPQNGFATIATHSLYPIIAETLHLNHETVSILPDSLSVRWQSSQQQDFIFTSSVNPVHVEAEVKPCNT